MQDPSGSISFGLQEILTVSHTGLCTDSNNASWILLFGRGQAPALCSLDPRHGDAILVSPQRCAGCKSGNLRGRPRAGFLQGLGVQGLVGFSFLLIFRAIFLLAGWNTSSASVRPNADQGFGFCECRRFPEGERRRFSLATVVLLDPLKKNTVGA